MIDPDLCLRQRSFLEVLVNKNTFATKKRRMIYARKVIGQEIQEPEFQQTSESWLKHRKHSLLTAINNKNEKGVRESDKDNKS